MFRNPQISAKALAAFCRSMSRMLEAGVEIQKSLKTSAAHSPDPRLPDAVKLVLKDVKKGDDLTTSFSHQSERFPELLLDLLNVGEQTGALPEVFASLAEYYEAHIRRVKEFRSQIAWPVTQLAAAILIIGGLIYLLGIIGSSNPGQPAEDVLGLGLVGTRGAVTWFSLTLGTTFFVWFGYTLAVRNAAGRKALHPFLLQVPAVGHCMKAFAIARFSWCFALTQQAGMPLKPSIESALRATGNGAFVQCTPLVWSKLKEGDTLTEALSSTGLFPEDYLQFVDTAEQTGTVPETLYRMSHHFDEDAQRSLNALTAVISRVVWLLVACFIGYIVISFFMRYVALLNSFM